MIDNYLRDLGVPYSKRVKLYALCSLLALVFTGSSIGQLANSGLSAYPAFGAALGTIFTFVGLLAKAKATPDGGEDTEGD